MKVLIIGSGGREHTLAWKLHQSPLVKSITVIPGNGGTKEGFNAPPLDLQLEDLIPWAKEEKIDLTVVGPEEPLVKGIVDAFQKEGLAIFGPSAKGALLEGSKIFAKELMVECGIPTGAYKAFHDVGEALAYLEGFKGRVVVKADGLAAGKGVFLAEDPKEASIYVKKLMIQGVLGLGGKKIILEEYLEGEEVSILAITDGHQLITLAPSSDHKRVFDGDKGENTGGMGAFSPAPAISQDHLKEIEGQILRPLLQGLRERDIQYRGVLYGGLMMTKMGPYVLEFNCRFGDPETQVVLPRLKDDLLPLLLEAALGSLKSRELNWDKKVALCVVMASGGYPKNYQTGFPITGLDRLPFHDDLLVFHGGTALKDGVFYTAGGRVLGVVAKGDSFAQAKEMAYQGIQQIHFTSKHFRQDIGDKVLSYGGDT